MAATLLLGIIGVTWQWRRAESNLKLAVTQRASAEINLAEADRQRQRAEANFRRAHQAVDDYFTLTSECSLLENPTLGPLRIELLEKAQQYYEDFIAQRGDDPSLQAELAAGYVRLASIIHDMGRKDWLPYFEKGLDILERLDLEQAPFWEFLSWRRGVNNSRAPQLLTAEPDRVWQAAQRGIAIWETLARRNPNVSGFRADLAELYVMAGMAQYWRMQPDEARAAMQRACDLRRQLADEHLGETRHRYALAESQIAAGMVENYAGNAPAAQRLIEDGCELLEALIRENPRATRIEMNLAWAYQQLAAVHVSSGRPTAALPQFNRGLQIQERLAHEYPTVPDFLTTCSESYRVLGDSLVRAGYQAQGEAAYAKAVDLLEERMADGSNEALYREALATSQAALHYQQGRAAQSRRDYETAAKSFAAALALSRDAFGEMHPEVAKCLRRLACVEAGCGRTDNAGSLFRQALAMQRDTLDDAHPDLATSLYEYAKFLRARGESAEAENHFRQAVTMQRKLYGETNERVAVSSYRLGDTLRDQGKIDAARDWYRQSLAILREIKPDDAHTHAVLRRLAETRGREGSK